MTSAASSGIDTETASPLPAIPLVTSIRTPTMSIRTTRPMRPCSIKSVPMISFAKPLMNPQTEKCDSCSDTKVPFYTAPVRDRLVGDNPRGRLPTIYSLLRLMAPSRNAPRHAARIRAESMPWHRKDIGRDPARGKSFSIIRSLSLPSSCLTAKKPCYLKWLTQNHGPEPL